jgi:hypothetical protein
VGHATFNFRIEVISPPLFMPLDLSKLSNIWLVSTWLGDHWRTQLTSALWIPLALKGAVGSFSWSTVPIGPEAPILLMYHNIVCISLQMGHINLTGHWNWEFH